VENGKRTKRVALYVRVSTNEQGERGFSIPEQERELRAHAQREGWHVVDVIVDEGHSGAVGVRPGLDRIMELAEAREIELVLAKKRDRLFRDRYIRIGYERALLEHCVSLVALDDAAHRLADAVMDEFGDWYREEVRKNTVAGRREKARQGKLIAAYRPIFGFEYTPDREAFVVVPHKMTVVRRVIETIASRKSIYGTKLMLEREGIPAPGGGIVWRESTIRDMVLNDAYRPHAFEELAPLLTEEAMKRLHPEGEYGVVWYPRKKITRLDPDPARNYHRPRKEARYGREKQIPIPVVSSGLDREAIDAARIAIKDNVRSRYTGDRVMQLAGLIRCSECGYPMTTNRRAYKNRSYHYYRCSNHQRYGSRGCAMSKNYPADALEQMVLHAVLDAVKDKEELIRKTKEKFDRERARLLGAGSAEAATWRRSLDEIERQRVRAQRAYMEDVITLEDLRGRQDELDAEKAHIERLLSEQEGRETRLRHLEATRDKTVRQIRRGEWGKLGITAPEARKERFREIGLRAEAADGTVLLSWGLGEETVLCATDPTSENGRGR
jgi:site-specific DNA recombinase